MTPYPQDNQIDPIITEETRTRKREIFIILLIVVFIGLLTFIESSLIDFGSDLPISNTILMFILININLLLLLLLIFLVFRNLAKLLYDRRRKIMGAKLGIRLIVAFIALSLAPTTVLFIFSLNFITSSIEYWFNAPVDQALDNSLQVGRRLYTHIEENNQFFLKRAAYQIEKKHLTKPQKLKSLKRYIEVVQKEFNIPAVEIYSNSAQLLSSSVSPELENIDLLPISPSDFQKKMNTLGLITLTSKTASGELIRTISRIPFDSSVERTKAYIVFSMLMSLDLSQSLASISKGYEEYQQIKLFKNTIQISYYITLSIVALLVVFSAIWFGFKIAKSISIPIKELAEGTRRVAEGDLSFSIKKIADDEIGSLVYSFNKMTHDLRQNRDQLEQSASRLQDQNTEIEEKRQYMEVVLKHISTGVISLDPDGVITTINLSAERMLNIIGKDVLNKSYKKLLQGPQLTMANEILERLSASKNSNIDAPFKLFVDGKPHNFLAHFSELKDNQDEKIGIVMVFDDLTEMEKAERMAAWREVARRIAHEVKNPLTPISLSAQRLKRKYSAQIHDPIFDECTGTIIDHVELIRNLVNEFSTFARFPSAHLKLCELPPIIEETVALYREGHPNINFEIKIDENIPALNLDRQQIKQALINLADNAIAMIPDKGQISILASYDSILKTMRLEFADTGIGITNEDKTHLFEPYFSKKKSGIGLGLTIVSTIIADHNGMISVHDNHPQGAKFVIEFPA